MFDSIGVFTRQFTPTDGGYLYYPSKKSGGKLISTDEYHDLVKGWHKVAGGTGILKITGMILLVFTVWAAVSSSLSFPEWAEPVCTAIVVAGLSAWLLWASYAPRRLVRDRPDITPPRPIADVRRQVRALLNWRFITFALLISGVAFLGALRTTERDIAGSIWLFGSGALFFLYIWIAFQKFRDR